ncbi:MAG: ATP-binding protein [Methanobrevibacter sp.]|nr:ATP-binding protein [Methanobrevibacter sp.]
MFNYNFYKIYISSLRGLIPLISKDDDNSNEDVYAKRIKDDYFGEKSNILVDVNDFLLNGDIKSRTAIISGMKFYEYVRNYLLGDLEQRDMIRDYEGYLSQTFFDNEKVVLIPKVNDDVLTVRIGEEEFKIYDLGEGIQSIILITLPLFLYLEKSKEENTNVLVFIEEPEVGLHPRLQRILIETLLDERFENYQFFFTTHSNHFLDKLFEKEDISIYSFDKSFDDESNAIFTIEKVGFDHIPTLKKLGALPSSVLANNCTILVEGSYDVVHYRFYLDLYQEKLINENPNLTKFEYGTHYSFLRGGGKETANTIMDFNKIQQERIFTVLDKDSNNDYIKNKAAFDKMGYKNYLILDVIEVENLISKEILIKILNSLREVRKLGISEQFNEEDYQKSNFYKFIKENIITGDIPEGFFNKSTFKERFSYKEQEFVDSFDDLSDAAKEVTKKIYKFIKESNLLSNDSN